MTTAIALMLQRFPGVIKKDGSFDVTAIVKNAYDSSKLLLTKKAHVSFYYINEASMVIMTIMIIMMVIMIVMAHSFYLLEKGTKMAYA